MERLIKELNSWGNVLLGKLKAVLWIYITALKAKFQHDRSTIEIAVRPPRLTQLPRHMRLWQGVILATDFQEAKAKKKRRKP